MWRAVTSINGKIGWDQTGLKSFQIFFFRILFVWSWKTRTICSHLLQNTSLYFPVSFISGWEEITTHIVDSNGSSKSIGSLEVRERRKSLIPKIVSDSYWLLSSLLSTLSQIKANGREYPTWNSNMGRSSWPPIHLFSLYMWRWNGFMKNCHLVSRLMKMWVVVKKKGKVEHPWVSSASWIWQNGQPDWPSIPHSVEVRSKCSKSDLPGSNSGSFATQ